MVAVVEVEGEGPLALRPRPFLLVRRAWATPGGKIGAVLILFVLGIAWVGPFFEPHSTTETIAQPFLGSSSKYLFGTDFLGRDTLSRFLAGGRSIILLALGATLLTYAIGVPVGLLIAYRRGWRDIVALGLVDLIVSFPALVLVLLLITLFGPTTWGVILAIAVVLTPRVMRLVRAATTDVTSLEFVEAAHLRGESTADILRREILPNVWTPIAADFGIRLTGAFLTVASLGFLGFGIAPPAPNWGTMISENRIGLILSPLSVLAPAGAIALFAIGVNLFSDAMARSLGRSVLTRGV